MGGEGILYGVIHLPGLPYTGRPGPGVEELVELAVREARTYEEAGFDGVIVENYGDAPFPPRVTDPLAIAAMTVVVREAVASTSLEVGVNVLRNSGLEAYSIAVAAGASFVRVNSLVEVLLAPSGVLLPEAPRLAGVRSLYPGVRVLADVACKHAASLTLAALSTRMPVEEALGEVAVEAVERGGADALVVTGKRTGEPPEPWEVEAVARAARGRGIPVLVGSGVSPENARVLLRHADGAIVGSYPRREGRAGAPLDPARAVRVARAVREALGG